MLNSLTLLCQISLIPAHVCRGPRYFFFSAVINHRISVHSLIFNKLLREVEAVYRPPAKLVKLNHVTHFLARSSSDPDLMLDVHVIALPKPPEEERLQEQVRSLLVDRGPREMVSCLIRRRVPPPTHTPPQLSSVAQTGPSRSSLTSALSSSSSSSPSASPQQQSWYHGEAEQQLLNSFFRILSYLVFRASTLDDLHLNT